MPITLPSVWARLGRFEHAEALARSITKPDAQAQALIELITATAQANAADRAEAVAGAITSPNLPGEGNYPAGSHSRHVW